MEKKIKKENIVITIVASLGFLVVYLAVSNLIPLGIQLFYYFTYSELRIVDNEAFTQHVRTQMVANVNYIGISIFMVFLAILFVIFKIKKTSLLKRIRWNPVSKQVYALVAVFAISNVIALNFLMDFLLPQSWVQGTSEYADMITSANGGLFLTIFAVVFVGPFGEEVLMRGLITTRLMERLPLWFAVAFPTILFGVGHSAGGMGQIIGTTVTGLVFALVFIWTNSLRTAVLAHSLNNLLSAILHLGALKSAMSLPFQLTAGIIGLLIAVFTASKIYSLYSSKNISE